MNTNCSIFAPMTTHIKKTHKLRFINKGHKNYAIYSNFCQKFSYFLAFGSSPPPLHPYVAYDEPSIS